jgi:hypothetical protein
MHLRDENMSSDFKYLNLIALNFLSFPIYEPLNPKLYVFHKKDLILYRNIGNVVHRIRGFINIFKVGIPILQVNHVIFFIFSSYILPPKLLKIKFK